MPKATLLTDEQIEKGLTDLPGWERVGDTLVKTFTFPSFSRAVAFVQALVPIADGMDHHPDVQIHWGTVELILWTHVSGGITQRDLNLARAIEDR